MQTNQYQKSSEQHHYYTNNKSKTIRKDTKIETIWKTKHKNIPSPNPKLLERSYKSPDLTSYSHEEIRLHLKPQDVTDVRRISICKETRIIDTNIFMLIFNKPTTPTSSWIVNINTKIKTYTPNPLRCQKYEHPRDKCARPAICAKCGKSNHTKLECQKSCNCINIHRRTPCVLMGMWTVEKRKKNNRNKIHKKYLLPWGQRNRTNTRTTQLCICNKKGNEEKEDKKQKQEELD